MKSPTFSDPLLSILLVFLLGFLVLILYAVNMLPQGLLSFMSGPRLPAVAQPVVNAPAAAGSPQISENVSVGGELAGREISLPAPEYPEAARSQDITDTIHVAITVNPKGRVIAARALNGPLLLQQSAEAAARKARFGRGRLKRRSGTIKYDFKL